MRKYVIWKIGTDKKQRNSVIKQYKYTGLNIKQVENNSISADSLIFGESFLKTLNKRLDGVRITGIFSLPKE